MTEDLEDVLLKLEGHAAELQSVIGVIGEQHYLGREDAESAREKLRDAKKRIEGAYRAGSTVSGRTQLTDPETRYYHPAVHKAFTRLPSLATRPGPKWVGQLIDARNTIKSYARELKSELDDTAG